MVFATGRRTSITTYALFSFDFRTKSAARVFCRGIKNFLTYIYIYCWLNIYQASKHMTIWRRKNAEMILSLRQSENKKELNCHELVLRATSIIRYMYSIWWHVSYIYNYIRNWHIRIFFPKQIEFGSSRAHVFASKFYSHYIWHVVFLSSRKKRKMFKKY